jgi:prepilin-type N-terminal cleavage/methylation domain-containing protein/prepilin-type processing-associated H-X9-DG protein
MKERNMSVFVTGRNRKGFSLLELIVILVLIAVLAAILTPVFTQWRIDAQSRQGEQNIRLLTQGILQYAQDHDNKFPRLGYDCASHDYSNGAYSTIFAPGETNQCGGDTWQNVVGPYVHDPSIFLAPGDKSNPGEGPWGGGTGTNFNTTDGNLSYVVNDFLAHPMPTRSDGYADPSQLDVRANGLPLTTVKTPANCLMICEGHGGWDKVTGSTTIVATDWTGSTDLQNKWHHDYSLVNETFLLTSRGYQFGQTMIRIGLPFNHNGGNVGFADGHTAFVPYATPSGIPMLCKTLSWPKTMDPLQRNADHDGCKDPNNPPGVGWTTPNWF